MGKQPKSGVGMCKKAGYIAYPRVYFYFFLCLFILSRFLRLWVAILCLFLFLPQGILVDIS